MSQHAICEMAPSTLNGYAILRRLAEPGLNAVAWNNTWAGLYFLLVLLSSLVLALLFVGVVFSMYTFLNLTHRGRRMTSLKQVGE